MTQTIKIQIRSIYGVDTVYPACPAAVAFASIAGTKTLTHRILCLIEGMGYAIVVEAPAYRRAA
jgi:hypothetical protein